MNGVLLFVAFSAGGLRASSWQSCLARSICCCTVVSLCNRFYTR